jgi:hypothetical protein
LGENAYLRHSNKRWNASTKGRERDPHQIPRNLEELPIQGNLMGDKTKPFPSWIPIKRRRKILGSYPYRPWVKTIVI